MFDIDETHSTFLPFTAYEDLIIKHNISSDMNEASLLVVADRIAGNFMRQPHVIIQRAFQCGLIGYKKFAHWLLSHRENGWRSDEIDLLIAHPDFNRRNLADLLGRSIQSVSKQCFELRLNNGGYLYRWSENELRVLRNSYHSLNIKELQACLNRSRIDIRHRMLALDLFNKAGAIPFTGRPKSSHRAVPLSHAN